MNKISKCFIRLFIGLSILFSSPLSAQELQLTSEQVKKIIVAGTPDDVKKLIATKIDVNGDYECSSMLNTAILSLMSGGYGGLTPEDTIAKINILIDAGADVNKETCNLTPLLVTAGLPVSSRNMETKLMDMLNTHINSPDDICEVNGINKPCRDTTSAERLQMKKELHDTLQEAVKELEPYYTKIADILLAHGADINKKSHGIAPLQTAALTPPNERPILLNYFLEKGADPNIKDFQGSTPLFVANFAGNKEIIDILIKSGADTTIRNQDGLLYHEFKTGEYSGQHN